MRMVWILAEGAVMVGGGRAREHGVELAVEEPLTASR